jgi:tRNA(Ile)-lysidine synthase
LEGNPNKMSHNIDLPDNLAEQANQLFDECPKELWHPRALKALEKCTLTDDFIGIACSGGADSTFCLLLIFAAFPELREKMVVLHYNHQLREVESDDDESFVTSMSKLLNLKCHIGKPQNKHHKLDEKTLRNLRLDFWEKLAKEEGVNAIIQGHHTDDVAETLLWRIARGASVAGLISPKPVSQIDKVRIIRPFISIKKDSIRKWLQKYSVQWREDSSNSETKYVRNKIRHTVMPAWKTSCDRELLKGIASTQELLVKDHEALEFHALESFLQCRAGNSLKLGPLQNLPMATQKRVLQKWIVENTQTHPFKVTLASKATLLVKSLCNDNFSSLQISNQYFVRKRGQYLDIEESLSKLPIPYTSTFQNCLIFLPNGSRILTERIKLGKALIDQILEKKINPKKEAFLASTKFTERLYIRSRIHGDRYKPLGAPGSKKVSDWMIDRKWTETQKVETPIFLNCSNDIVWIPGFPPAEFSKVTRADKWVIRLTYRLSGT